MKKHPLLAFFLLTFLITWGLGACFALFPDQLTALFGKISPSNPLFLIAVYAPSFSALVVTGVTCGAAGVRDLLSRLFRWRVGLRWYVTALLGLPALGFVFAAVDAWLSGKSLKLHPNPWDLAIYPLLTSLVIDPGPLGEELGWRGFALPRLLQGRSALSASLILGVVWGIWHLPAFFFSGLPQNQLSIPAFLVGVAALSVLMTWVYQNTQGSVLFAVLIHWLINNVYLPWGSLPVMSGGLVLAAVIVVAVYGPAHLSRIGAKPSECTTGLNKKNEPALQESHLS
jgi:membrane protease YdiL (CAAX protease family)